ncbi:MAG: hypothetical protein ABI743_02335 [bacterium]
MRRLMAAFALLLLTTALAGCSGGTPTTSADPEVRANTGTGPGQPPAPPDPSCLSFFDIVVHNQPDPNTPPRTYPADLALNHCVPDGVDADLLAAFRLRADAPDKMLRIKLDNVPNPDGPGNLFAGDRVDLIGNEQRGCRLSWHVTVRVVNAVVGNGKAEVVGQLDRVRTRWFIRDGERVETTDRIRADYAGVQEVCPPPPPPPPGGGG